MNNILEYKGYYTKIEYSSEDKVLHGKIEGIGDLVTFQSPDATKIVEEFNNAVDDYLEFCEEVEKEPDKSYKGSFNIRINPDLHRKLAIKAFMNNESLNQTVEKAIQKYLEPPTEVYNELCAALTRQYTSYNENIYTNLLYMWKKYISVEKLINIPIKNSITFNNNSSHEDMVEMGDRYDRFRKIF